MNTTTVINGLRPLTAPEEKAVELAARGIPDFSITLQTRLSPEQIETAKARHAEWEQLRTATAKRGPAAKPAPVTAAEQRPRLTTGALLAWADEHGTSRARTLAARIREAAKELRTLQEGDAVRAQAQAEVDRLAAELETAKARLREAGGKTKAAPTGRRAGSAPTDERKAFLAAVRAWAADNQMPVSPLGRIPAAVVEAYHAATGGTP